MTDSWSTLEADFHAVERTLQELLERTQALAAHLVDRAGRVVLSVGPGVDYDLNAFASLAAADLAANDELMQLFGSTRVDGVACLGSHRSMVSSLVADRLVLCVIFDRRSTLGLVRHRMRRATEQLSPVFEGLFEKLGVATGPAPARAVAAPPGPARSRVKVARPGRRVPEARPLVPEPQLPEPLAAEVLAAEALTAEVLAPEVLAPESVPSAARREGEPLVPVHFGVEAAAALDDLLGGDAV